MRLFICAVMSTFTILACGTAQSQLQQPPLGLWVWSAEEADSQFDVQIEKSEDGWRAQIGAAPAQVQIEGGVIAFDGPDGQSFTGKLSADGQTMEGRWLQPLSALGYHETATPSYQGHVTPSYQEMVTPISLPAAGANRWRATITVQPRPYTVFLDIFEAEDASVFAVIRNPELNEIQGATRFRVLAETAGEWTLVAGEGDRERRSKLTRKDDQILHLEHRRFEDGVLLRPAAESDVNKYYSRPQTDAPARYTPPPHLNDGWEVATAEQVGVDRTHLDALVADLASSDPRNRRPRMLHSMLVAYKGKLVFEEYFNGHTRNTPHDTRSLAKVFGPVLMGALRYKGDSISPEDRSISGILQQAGETLDHPRKADITLAHLMSFSSGLDCDVNSDTSAGSEENMWRQEDELDFWLYTARLKSLYTPGERYAYCSGSINLVGASLRAAAGKPIIETFDDLIAKPLQFGPYHWDLAPNGAAYLGGGVYMRPRDILKVGAMHAAGGVWNGQRIVSKAWVTESTSAKIAISPETTGLSPDDFSNNYFGGSQAYIWHVGKVTAGDRAYASYQATGNGGQVLVVIPELELVAALTGGNYGMGGIWGRWRNELIGGYIIPALTEHAEP